MYAINKDVTKPLQTTVKDHIATSEKILASLKLQQCLDQVRISLEGWHTKFECVQCAVVHVSLKKWKL